MAHRFDDKCENSVSISISLMDKLLVEFATLIHADWLEHATDANIADYQEKKSITLQKLAEAKKNIEGLANKRDRIQDLYISGDLSKERYDNQKAKLMADEATFNAEIEKYTAEIAQINSIIEELQQPSFDKFMQHTSNIMSTTDKNDLKAIINQHIESCYVERVTIDGKKAIEIEINPKKYADWTTRKYIYFYTMKDKNKQLYNVIDNGEFDELINHETGDYYEYK